MNLKIEEREVHRLASGHGLTIKTFRLKSDRPGPTVCIQASVHGAEVQGQAVIYRLLEYLANHPFRGEIIMTPVANPQAINNKSGTFTTGRFNPVTGDNWNRLYTDLIPTAEKHNLFSLSDFVSKYRESSVEEIRAAFKTKLKEVINELMLLPEYGINGNRRLHLTLQEIAAEADIMLDFHTGPAATRYLYVPEFLREKSSDLLFPYHLVIPHEFAGAMDEAVFCPWMQLADKFAEQGRELERDALIEAYTVEWGSEEIISMEEASTDLLHVLHLFARRDVLDSEGSEAFQAGVLSRRKGGEKPYRCALADYKYIYTNAHGICEFHIQPGDVVVAGSLLAKIYNLNALTEDGDLRKTVTEVRADEDVIIINHCPSAIVASGVSLIQVMTNFSR